MHDHVVSECFWWFRITLILAFNSQGPKALAEVQRGWHQKFTQLVKQPLSKGFLSAFQASQMYQIISARSLSYQKIQYFDVLFQYIKTLSVEK